MGVGSARDFVGSKGVCHSFVECLVMPVLGKEAKSVGIKPVIPLRARADTVYSNSVVLCGHAAAVWLCIGMSYRKIVTVHWHILQEFYGV